MFVVVAGKFDGENDGMVFAEIVWVDHVEILMATGAEMKLLVKSLEVEITERQNDDVAISGREFYGLDWLVL